MVFPLPGGPQNSMEGNRFELMILLRTQFSPKRWSCPTKSRICVGRSLVARGAFLLRYWICWCSKSVIMLPMEEGVMLYLFTCDLTISQIDCRVREAFPSSTVLKSRRSWLFSILPIIGSILLLSACASFSTPPSRLRQSIVTSHVGKVSPGRLPPRMVDFPSMRLSKRPIALDHCKACLFRDDSVREIIFHTGILVIASSSK